MEQRQAFCGNKNILSYDHFYFWANEYAINCREDEGSVNLLFIDLTPGQVASQWATGSASNQRWGYRSNAYGSISLGDVRSFSTDEVYDKLVRLLVPVEAKLQRVGILHPEGAFPDVCAADLESIFPDASVKWLTLDDLSHAAAVVMSREPTGNVRARFSCPPRSTTTYLPMGIALANGEALTIFPKDLRLPIRRKFFFTNSKDNQRTITVNLLRGKIPVGEVTLEGLVPRPRCQAAIKVTVYIENYGNTTVTVGEIGAGLEKAGNIGSVVDGDESRITAYKAYEKSGNKQIGMTLGENGTIGEPPE